MGKINRLRHALFSGGLKGHFGQWAEDVLVRKLFPKNKKDGVYLDIGAYHPFTHSNTAYFWMKGWHGINVDANPNTIQLFNRIRPGDINLWAAVVPRTSYDTGLREVELLLPKKSDLSSGVVATGTISEVVGRERGFSEVLKVPAACINSIIQTNNIQQVDYLNIDIEGYDEAILYEIDFSVLRPTVVTIEDYADDLKGLATSKITQKMEENQYALVARAGKTSIFLRF